MRDQPLLAEQLLSQLGIIISEILVLDLNCIQVFLDPLEVGACALELV